jgi:hypothetical protein
VVEAKAITGYGFTTTRTGSGEEGLLEGHSGGERHSVRLLLSSFSVVLPGQPIPEVFDLRRAEAEDDSGMDAPVPRKGVSGPKVHALNAGSLHSLSVDFAPYVEDGIPSHRRSFVGGDETSPGSKRVPVCEADPEVYGPGGFLGGVAFFLRAPSLLLDVSSVFGRPTGVGSAESPCSLRQ